MTVPYTGLKLTDVDLRHVIYLDIPPGINETLIALANAGASGHPTASAILFIPRYNVEGLLKDMDADGVNRLMSRFDISCRRRYLYDGELDCRQLQCEHCDLRRGLRSLTAQLDVATVTVES